MTSSVRWMMMALPVVMSATFSPRASATGGWVPDRWLDEGGTSLQASPEFYWDIELTRLAKENSEKDLPFKLKRAAPPAEGEEAGPATTAKDDIADFEDALKTGRLKPGDPDAALKAHVEMRTFLEGDTSAEAPKSVEVASEFADYHKGANHYAHKNLPEAREAWKKLLLLPPEERHYRSVWAAYMLGKSFMMDEKTRKEAIAWFEKCRKLARDGFADSAGLAADSYGWQARVEYDAGNHPASARHYLQQLALGDTSAINSLKLLVPDRTQVGDLSPLSFSTFPPSAEEEAAETQRNEAEVKAAKEKAEKEMMIDMKDPVLRQIITAHILATAGQGEGADQSRLHHWLESVGKAKLGQVEGAASLGWAAYMEANYAEAARWARLEKPATPLGRWLQAKLALRNGDFPGAAAIMKGVLPGLPDDEGTRYDVGYLPKASAAADLGASLLAQGQFTGSLAAFWNGGCWEDAAYVAERVLTTEELTGFVKANATPASGDPEQKNSLRNLTGRRLIRDGRIAEGRALLNQKALKNFDAFQALIAKGDDTTVAKKDRARAWFDAAQLLRTKGSSWRGTEDDILRVEWGGYAPENPGELIKDRLAGRTKEKGGDNGEDGDGENKKAVKTVPLFVSSTPTERKRLERGHPVPMERYVLLAADLASKAATLLPDDAEETADVLNLAGHWIQDLDNPGADKIYFQIEKRCKNSEIGRAVIKKHWFVDAEGPWTKEAEDSGPATDDR